MLKYLKEAAVMFVVASVGFYALGKVSPTTKAKILDQTGAS